MAVQNAQEIYDSDVDGGALSGFRVGVTAARKAEEMWQKISKGWKA